MRSGWRYDADLMKRTLKFGVPSGLQWALEGLAFSIFLVFIGRMSNGDAALAASGIVVTVMMLAVLPPWVWPSRVGARRTAPGKNAREIGSRDVERIAGGFDVHPPRGSNVRALSEFLSQLVLQSQQPELWAQVRTIVPYLLMYIALFTSFDAMNMVFSFASKARVTPLRDVGGAHGTLAHHGRAHLSDERLERCGLLAWGARACSSSRSRSSSGAALSAPNGSR